MKKDLQELSDDLEKNLKFLGKEIFGNVECLFDINFLLKRMKLN